MQSDVRLPIGVWIATCTLVVVLALQVDAFIYVAAPYLALNGLALTLGLTRTPPLSVRTSTVLAWCTAAQLPTMLSLIFDVDANRNPRHQLERHAAAESEVTARRDERPDVDADGSRPDRPPSQRKPR